MKTGIFKSTISGMGVAIVCLVTIFAGCSKRDQSPSNATPPAAQNAQGTMDGGGGIGANAEWEAVAGKILDGIRKLNGSKIGEELLNKIKSNLKTVVKESKVHFVDYPLILGVEQAGRDNPENRKFTGDEGCDDLDQAGNPKLEKDAINFSQAKLIKVSRKRLKCYDKAELLMRLVLHEYLGLLEIEKSKPDGASDYSVTNILIDEITRLPNFEKPGFTVHAIKTCEDLRKAGVVLSGILNGVTPEQMDSQAVKEELESYAPKTIYRLQNDLECSDIEPIAIINHLDGNGYTIRNLKMRGAIKAALFSYICSRCEVANLKITGAEVEGSALLAARNYGTISNVDVQGTLTVTSRVDQLFAGGLVAKNGGTIQQSNLDVIVTDNQVPNPHAFETVTFTGGIAGESLLGRILKVSGRSVIQASWTVGGAVGSNASEINEIHLETLISVKSPLHVGGLVGINLHQLQGAVTSIEGSVVNGAIRLEGTSVAGADLHSQILAAGLVGFSEAHRSQIKNTRAAVHICGIPTILAGKDAKSPPLEFKPKGIVGLTSVFNFETQTYSFPTFEEKDYPDVKANVQVAKDCKNPL